jgi:hypothetical protein
VSKDASIGTREAGQLTLVVEEPIACFCAVSRFLRVAFVVWPVHGIAGSSGPNGHVLSGWRSSWRRPNCADPNMIGKSLEAAFQKIVYNRSINDDSQKVQDLAAHWWQTIISAYSEPQRHYHTVNHIESMWKVLEMVPEDQVSDRDAVVLAILFHECAGPSNLAQW